MVKLWLVNLSALMKSFCHTRPGNLARRISREFGHLLAIRSVSQKFISPGAIDSLGVFLAIVGFLTEPRKLRRSGRQQENTETAILYRTKKDCLFVGTPT